MRCLFMGLFFLLMTSFSYAQDITLAWNDQIPGPYILIVSSDNYQDSVTFTTNDSKYTLKDLDINDTYKINLENNTHIISQTYVTFDDEGSTGVSIVQEVLTTIVRVH